MLVPLAAVLCAAVPAGTAGIVSGTGSDTASAGTPNKEIVSCENKNLTKKIRVYDNQGKSVKAAQADASAYEGYIFQVKKNAPSAYATGQAAAKEKGIKAINAEGLYQADSLKKIDAFVDDSYVEYVEPDYQVELFDSEIKENTASPDDPAYKDGQQWNMKMMNTEAAWETGSFGQPQFERGESDPVVVGVIDSGLTGTDGAGGQEPHEDIDYRLVEDGKNLATSESGTPDTNGHGSFVSGLIFAKMNNGKGMTGAMPEVHICPLKVFGTAGSCSDSDVINAIYEAMDKDVDVINMSLGSAGYNSSLQEACDAAAAKGILVVAAAGNDGTRVNNYPAAFDSVVGVGSLDSDGSTSYFSQIGASVFVTAPGSNIYSIKAGTANGYRTGDGTSFASPEVAALAAMAKSISPDITQEEFKELLKTTSEDKGSEGYDEDYGWGAVNFGAAAEKILENKNLPSYNLNFQVSDESGEAVSDAEIHLKAADDIHWDADEESGTAGGSLAKGTEVQPESDGSYVLHKGTYSYTVSKNGYTTASGELTTYTKNQKVRAKIEKTYAMAFDVKDSDDNLLDNVTLKLTRESGKEVYTPQQNENAEYTARIPAGVYRYEAKADGYTEQSGTFSVAESGTREIRLYTGDEVCRTEVAAEDAASGDGLTDVKLSVMDTNGDEIEPSAPGIYHLVRGSRYVITAEKAGFEDAVKKYKAEDAAEKTLRIPMRQVSATTEFLAVDGRGENLSDSTTEVWNSAGELQQPFETNDHKYNLKNGTYSYRVASSGYGNETGSFEIDTAQSDNRKLSVVLHKEKAAVTVRAEDQDGNVLKNADISIYDSSQNRQTGTAAGNWQLGQGTYTVYAYLDGYEGVRQEFQVPAAAVQTKGAQEVTLTMKQQTDSADLSENSGGKGTAEDPYLISTEQQLRNLAKKTEIVFANNRTAATNQREKTGGYYRLVKDIRLTEGTWTPIGNYENSENYNVFTGNFDGNGHTISGLQVKWKQNSGGLFGAVYGASIKNLTVQGSVSGRMYTGGIVGQIINHQGVTAKIENCRNDASVTAVSSSSSAGNGSCVGGIVGYVSATSDSVKANVEITACCNTGAVTAENDYAGGIAGMAYALKTADCYNWGKINASKGLGGIAGCLQKNTYTYNCYSTGEIEQNEPVASSAVGYVGGIAGSASGGYFSRDYFRKGCGVKAAIGVENTANTDKEYVKYQSQTAMTASQRFVDELNLMKDTRDDAYVLSDTYPLLRWQTEAAEKQYAETPVFLEQPEGNADHPYACGASAGPITAEVAPVNDGGTLTYQWYKNEIRSTKQAEKLTGEGASGTVPEDGVIAWTPSLEETGTTYYYAVVKNTLADDSGKTSVISRTRSTIVPIVVQNEAPVKDAVIRGVEIGESGATAKEITAGESAVLRVKAESADGGTLSYQWYRSSTARGKGTAVKGADRAEYTADPEETGTWYYYAEVTNTITSDADGKTYSSRVQSERLKVTVKAKEPEVTKPEEPSEPEQPEVPKPGDSSGSEKPVENPGTNTSGGKSSSSGSGTSAAQAMRKAVPKRVKAASVSGQSLKITWKKTAGAKGYVVYRKSGGTYKKVLATAKTGAVVKKLKAGQKYTFRVRAYCVSSGKKVYSRWSIAVSARPIPAAPGKVKAVRINRHTVRITYKKSAGASGYQILRASGKKGKYKAVAVVKKGSRLSYTDRSAGSKSRYKVRAYCAVGKKKLYGKAAAAH